jgi:16S rRNA (uracil1498-N3)-methyltransferase
MANPSMHTLPASVSKTSRFFCSAPLPSDRASASNAQHAEWFTLPEDIAHHAVKVLRMKEGEQLRLFDGSGGEWLATLQQVKPRAEVSLEAFFSRDSESPLKVTLLQSLPSGDKMDWIVQKCTELGIAAVQPVSAKRSVLKLSGEKAEKRGRHWQSVAVSACEQSGRNVVPTVGEVTDLAKYLANCQSQALAMGEVRYALIPGATQSLREMSAPTGPVTILVGPEGGLDESEQQAALAAGFTPISLGPRILRTETAGTAVLAAMMALWGDW